MRNNCEKCKHWIQMKEHEGQCMVYGFPQSVWTPADATCDEWESDDDE